METCIRKGLGLKAHRVREVREESGRLVAEIEWIAGRRLICGGCWRQAKQVYSARPEREWRDLRIRDQDLVLRYAPRRVRCRDCGVRVERILWADRWQRITKALSRGLAELSRKLSWKETAGHFGVDWKTVASAVRRAVQWGLKNRPWRPALDWDRRGLSQQRAALPDTGLRPGTGPVDLDRREPRYRDDGGVLRMAGAAAETVDQGRLLRHVVDLHRGGWQGLARRGSPL